MDLATFYLAMAALLLVGLGIHSIFDRPRTARLVLALVLIGGYFYLLSGASDGSSLLWCLTIIPVLVGCFGYRHSVFLLGSVLAASAWLFYGPSTFSLMPAYSDVTLVRFLSSFAVLSLFAIAMDNLTFSQPQPLQRSVPSRRPNCPSGSAHQAAQSPRYGAATGKEISTVPPE